MIDFIQKQDSDFHKKFISNLQRRNKRIDTKNIQLYKQLINSNTPELKNKMSSNAYNVLKKRLLDALLDFMVIEVMENESNSDISNYKRFFLGRSLINDGFFRDGLKVLRTLKKSLKIHELNLQIEVLSLMIEVSSEMEDFNLDMALVEYRELQKKYEYQQQLNVIFALIKNELKRTKIEESKISFGELIKESFDRFKMEIDNVIDIQTLSRLAQLADLFGEKNRAYHEIESFFDHHIERLTPKGHESISQIINSAQLYYSLANIELRKKDFKRSLKYLENLLELIDLYPEKLTETFYFKHSLLLSLNLNYVGKPEEAENLLNLIEIEESNRMYPSIQLTRMMLYIQRGAFKEALRINHGLSHRDSWYEKRVGVEWLLNKKFLEVILYIELNYEDLIESKIRSLLNLHSKTLSMEQNKQVKPFIKVVKRMLNYPEEITNGKLEQRLYQIGLTNIKETDLFFLSFYSWLRSKLNNKNINDNLLELLAMH